MHAGKYLVCFRSCQLLCSCDFRTKREFLYITFINLSKVWPSGTVLDSFVSAYILCHWIIFCDLLTLQDSVVTLTEEWLCESCGAASFVFPFRILLAVTSSWWQRYDILSELYNVSIFSVVRDWPQPVPGTRILLPFSLLSSPICRNTNTNAEIALWFIFH